MSSQRPPQSLGYGTLPHPPIGNESETRLPGVQQLLLPHTFAAPIPFSPSSQHSHDQADASSMVRILTPSDNSHPPPKRASEGGAWVSQTEEADFPNWRRQSTGTSSMNAMVALKQHNPLLLGASPQQPAPIDPAQEPLSNPTSPQYNATHGIGSGLQSSRENYSNDFAGFRTSARQNSESNNTEDLSPRQIRANSWHSPLPHPDWGTTKAGRPRKRLAQACLNCRQKKIRCHPGPDSKKCTQCEKTHTACKFESGCVVRKLHPKFRTDHSAGLERCKQSRFHAMTC
jgi:hypothetical protein